jgi:hypothetical protein
MIIERWEFKVKPGHLEEAKNLILSMDWGRPYKLHESEMGELYRLTSFVEFESIAEMEQVWSGIGSAPEYESFLKKWRPLINSTERTLWRSIETSG